MRGGAARLELRTYIGPRRQGAGVAATAEELYRTALELSAWAGPASGAGARTCAALGSEVGTLEAEPRGERGAEPVGLSTVRAPSRLKWRGL